MNPRHLHQLFQQAKRAFSLAFISADNAFLLIGFLLAGGTRFIGVYLARDLINQGHDVTLLTRGKSPITSQIPDDTDATFKQYTDAVNHIAVDRKDASSVKEKLASGGFEGVTILSIL